MKILLRALPYILVAAALYTGWYYWQQRPKQALAADLLQLEVENIKQVFVTPSNGPAFQFGQVEQGWLVSSGHHHLLEVSQRPDTLLRALLSMRSLDVAPTPAAADLHYHIDLELIDGTTTQFDLYRAPDTVSYQTIVRFGKQPDFFALEKFDPEQLPLAFSQYRSYQMLDLSAMGQLDSLAWTSVDSSLYYWSRPDSSQQLDSIYVLWEELLGRDFADYFDEIGDESDWHGSYHLYGGSDSAELRVYFDSLWPMPFVLYSNQFPNVYFGLDSLPLELEPAVLVEGGE